MNCVSVVELHSNVSISSGFRNTLGYCHRTNMSSKAAKRFGAVIHLKPEKLEEYKKLHASVWPKVLKRIEESNIRNYTIYHCKELGVLFSHLEYFGDDYDKDMAAIAADPTTKEWWKVCEPCQRPLEWEGPPPSEGGSGNWWQPMEEVFHDGHPASSYS